VPVRVAADVLAAAADAPLSAPVTIWGYGVGGYLAGLVRAGGALDRPDLVDRVRSLVEPALDRGPDPTDHLIPVETLLALRGAVPSLDIDDACRRWLDAVLGASRPVPGQPPVHRPDLEPWQHTMWVDCLHTDGPGLALVGRPAEAVALVSEVCSVHQRSDGLFQHGYDVLAGTGNDVAWGRGQGWALLGLVGTLEIVGSDALRARLGRLVSALAGFERDGSWGTVVDDPSAPVEDSTGAYVAAAVGRAVRLGLVDSSYGAMASRAYERMLSVLEDGALVTTSATPVGVAAAYLDRPTGVYAWGQAPVLQALLDRLDGSAA
jgi:unsaturated rhamnogalacturonyl hydrolase